MYEKYIKPYIIPVLVLLLIGGYAGYVLGGGRSSSDDSGRVQQIQRDIEQVRQDIRDSRNELIKIRQGVIDSRTEIAGVRTEIETIRGEVSASREEIGAVRERTQGDIRLISETRQDIRERQLDLDSIRKRNEIKSSQP